MRWVYIAVIVVVFVLLAWFPSPGPVLSGITETVTSEAQVPNAVTAILLRNRLYDTIFEVFVFTLAVLGVQHYFSQHETEEEIVHLTDPTMVILAHMGAIVSSLIFVELALRGHLAPGGGFAAGVAGGTALCLMTLTSDVHKLHERHRYWRMAMLEKAIVLLFLFVAGMLFLIPHFTLAIPLMNVLIACKVAIGSWTIVLLFIRHRGLL
ncbi:MnhB domain-containing protein [Planctomycetota bacterium]